MSKDDHKICRPYILSPSIQVTKILQITPKPITTKQHRNNKWKENHGPIEYCIQNYSSHVPEKKYENTTHTFTDAFRQSFGQWLESIFNLSLP